ncbi:MAG: hypothetical protein WDN48_04025, partial [Pseudolabrys sp.]
MLIATRTLTYLKGSDKIQIPIRIFAPAREKPGVWGCRYEIDWPDKKSANEIFGFDSIQALVLALQTIGAEIYSSNYHKSGNMFFDKPGEGYGFPVVSTLRDLLQGSDAKYL